jgi:cytochrome c553
MFTKTVLLVVALCLFTEFSYAQSIENGEAIFKKRCIGCHGRDGRNKAFGKSNIIAGQPTAALREHLAFYKDSDFNERTSTAVMSKQVRKLDDKEIADVTAYVSTLSK